MTRHGLIMHTLAVATALVIGQAAANTQQRPRAEDYANYAEYIQALVDYQRAQETAPATAAKAKSTADSVFCTSEQGGCEGKYLLVENVAPAPAAVAETPAQSPAASESVDEVINRARYTAPAPSPDAGLSARSTFSDFPLSEISSQDLSDSGVEGALGLFENVRIKPLTQDNRTLALAGRRTEGSDEDGMIRAGLDSGYVTFEQTEFPLLGGMVVLRNGYTYLRSTVMADGDDVNIELSSETRTSLYAIDRDGMPGTALSKAGAVTVNQIGVIIPHLKINQSVRRNGGNELFQITTFSPQPIYVDLAGTRIGASAVDDDGFLVGDPIDFLTFGPDALLTIDAGTNVVTSVGRPRGLRRAFVTLNGHVGNINLEGISLLGDRRGNGIHIGKLSVRNVELADAKIFVDDQKLTLDLGNSLSDAEVDIERLRLGADTSPAIGDFYARGAKLQELKFIITAH